MATLRNRLLLYGMGTEAPGSALHYTLDHIRGCAVLRIATPDPTNVLSRVVIRSLYSTVENLRGEAALGRIRALIITGNDKFFSAGADLKEIAQLSGPEAFAFSRSGQRLMNTIDSFPVPVVAAILGYCMGGGMDLALACDYRIAGPAAVFGHRGASLGVITGWGGTQRLPRLIGKARALKMFLLAEMVNADEALRIRLVDEVCDNPVAGAAAFAVRQRGANGKKS